MLINRSVGAAWVAAVCILFGWAGMGVLAARPVEAGSDAEARSEENRIAALLDAAEHSDARFVREGKEYSGAEGRRHLERKLWWAGGRITTAEEFIEGIASRSSTTGRPYLVRLPNGEVMPTGVWFRHKLKEIDASH